MTTAVVVQARMGSSRLPGKVMREIAGRPMIDRVVDRARSIPGVDALVVATSTEQGEAPLVEHLRDRDVLVHRGPEEDVLARFVGAARSVNADVVVRITGDCPLLMPEVSGRVLARFRSGDCDYASNILERTYPRGLDTEVLGVDTLAAADREASDPADREHVTLYVRRQPVRFRLCSVTASKDRSDLRWTVDEEPDLELVRRVSELLKGGEPAGYREVLTLFEERPELRDMNSQVRQKTS